MPFYMSGYELHKAFLEGSLSAQEIAQSFLDHSARCDPKVKAFLQIFSNRFLEQAKELDRKRARNAPLGKMAAVPVAIKDNIHLRGEITTCGSKILENFKAPFHATAVEKLLEEDALLLGKLNMDEFGMGSSTENSAFFPTHNPWDFRSVPGGSSGGSAAAVAARMTPIALGSDTGGSIRQPAAFCGVFGFKPSYGRVSRWGLVAFASSLDVIGPIAHDLRDIALTMEVIGAPCRYDSTSSAKPPENYDLESLSVKKKLRPLRLAVPFPFLENLQTEVKAQFLESLEKAKEAGCILVECNLDLLHHSLAVYYILSTAEAATNLARFDGVRYGIRSKKALTAEASCRLSRQEGFGKEVKRRILMGNYCLSSDNQEAYFRKAQKVRRLLLDRYKSVFENCDYILMPTTPTTAFALGEIQDPFQMYLGDIYTIGVNLAGLPALSLPTGFAPRGVSSEFSSGAKALPLGMQIIGPHGSDRDLLLDSLALCQSCNWSSQFPKEIPKASQEKLSREEKAEQRAEKGAER